MFLFENNLWLWFFVLLFFDVLQTHLVNKLLKDENEKEKVEIIITGICNNTIVFLVSKTIWVYRCIKYCSLFWEENPDDALVVGTWIGVLSALEFIYAIIVSLASIYYILCFFDIYERTSENSANCSLKLFMQLYNLDKIVTKRYTIGYKYEKERCIIEQTDYIGYTKSIYKRIKFNIISFIIVCYILQRKNEITDYNNKKEEQNQIDSEFYKTVIKDLEKIKEENEKKSIEFLKKAKYK